MKTLLISLAFISMGCAGMPADPCKVTTPGSSINVWSFGDSITAGAGADHACNGYQSILTQDVKGNSQDEGISGSPLTVEFQFIMSLNYSDTVSINTILPGFNDVSIYGSDPNHLALFEYELTQALMHLNGLGKMTLVGTTLYVTQAQIDGPVPKHTNASVDLYVNTIKQVVNQLNGQGFNNLHLVDTNAVYDPNTMSNANYHPDNYGHQVLANAFYQVYQSN